MMRGEQSAAALIDWDDVAGWGGRVHIAAWAPDPKHEDASGDDQ